MEYLRLIGSYGRLTKVFSILLRSEILGSGIQPQALNLDLNLDPGSGPWIWPGLVPRPTSKNPTSNIYRFRGSLIGIS